jgi:hypothetical protein
VRGGVCADADLGQFTKQLEAEIQREEDEKASKASFAIEPEKVDEAGSGEKTELGVDRSSERPDRMDVTTEGNSEGAGVKPRFKARMKPRRWWLRRIQSK